MDGDQPELGLNLYILLLFYILKYFNSLHLELSDDPYDTKRLNTENLPCVVTLMKVCRLRLVQLFCA